jgi:hypothetical protein
MKRLKSVTSFTNLTVKLILTPYGTSGEVSVEE